MSTKVLNIVTPVNWAHPLTRGLVARYRCIPGLMSGSRIANLALPATGGAMANMAHPVAGWTSTANRQGGHGAVKFDGTDDYITSGTSLVIPAGSLSFAGWFRATTVDSTTRYICGVQNGGFDGGRFIRLTTTNKLQFEVIGNSVKDANSAATIVADRWYHFVAVKDDQTATATIYINGIADGSVSLAGVTYSALLSNFKIGTRPDVAPSLVFAGFNDDISVWHRALSASEVFSLYWAVQQPCDPLLNWNSYPMLDVAAAPGGSIPFFYNRYVVGRSR